MPWSSLKTNPRHRAVLWRSPLRAIAVILVPVLFSAGVTEPRRLSVYSTAANYSVSVIERKGIDYSSLLELLDPLGTVTANTDRSHWKIRCNSTELEFVEGKTKVRMHGGDFDLSASFVLENGRGLVPLASLATLLPRILGGPVTFHDTSRRLFVGSVATHFTAELASAGQPRLVMNFSAPVAPVVNQEPGKLHLIFSHEPLVAPGSPLLTFGSPTIPSASYREDNGAAEITIAATVPLSLSSSNSGRTLTLSPLVQISSQSPVPVTPPTPPTAAASLPHRYFVVIDASHGGSERGAALNDQIPEKDITLAFGRRLRQELVSRGFSALLIRDGDMTLSLDQRADFANTSHPALYICLHAASQDAGVRVYTALLPPAADNRGPFLDWNTAQSPFRVVSQVAAASIAAQMQKNRIPVRILVAGLRPLNNITSAALAVEVGPSENDVSELVSTAYQQSVASSIAMGVASVRDRLEAGR